MLSKCANPSCSASFRYFHQGKLFRMEMETLGDQPADSEEVTSSGRIVRRTEFFWLCDRCASEMTLESATRGRVFVRPVVSDLQAAS